MPSTDPSDTEGIDYYHIPSFTFANGETIPIKVAYRSFNPSAKKTVLIPTCYGGRINSTLNFTAGCLADYHVIVAATLGNGESSSPSNHSSFPPNNTLRYEDSVSAHHALLSQHLGLPSLDAVLGFSMGGQQAYYWAVMHGSSPSPYVKNAIVICGSAKTSPHNYAFLEGPLSALLASAAYERYRSDRQSRPTEGLRAFGRAYAAWLTSAQWYREGLWREFGGQEGEGSLRDWLYPPVGMGPFESWDADDLVVMGRMWQGGDVGRIISPSNSISTSTSGSCSDRVEKGDWREKLGKVECRVLVMPSLTDQYFDWKDGEEEMRWLKRGTWAPIDTIWGHVAGGGANKVDTEWMDGRIGEFLAAGDE